MQPSALLSTLGKLVTSQKPLITGVTDSPQLNNRFEPGQKLQGQVQAEASPGTFKVRIADMTMQMRLPQNIRSGDNISLQVVATNPKLVFSLSASSNPISTPDQLSSAARLFSAIAQQQPEKALIRAPQEKPIWNEITPPPTGQIAGRLHEALSTSGLFYESHQVQWLEGTRSTAQLLNEPQNAPPMSPATETESSRQTLANLNNPLTAAVPEHLQPIVQQQINALNTQQVVWQGQAWPGQEMQWEIHDESQGNDAEAVAERTWSTEIRLELPNLGEVSATFRFSPSGLSLALDATNDSTRNLLGKHTSRLGASMSEHGIPLTNALIVQHDET